MEREGSKHLSLNDAYRFGLEQGLEREVNEIRNMEIEWDRSYTSSLRRGFIADLFERKGLLVSFKERYWPNGDTAEGERLLRRYRKIKAQYDDFLLGREPDRGDEAEMEEEDQRFAAESDLRDFLAKNLDRLEPGMRLFQRGDQGGVEFPVDDGRIDILAIDRDGRFVVLEFKLSQGRNRALGQLLYYMGWVDKNLGNGPCRGIIVAKEISSDLAIATQRVPGVALFRYNLSVSVERVG
jgi:hypothetical protein